MMAPGCGKQPTSKADTNTLVEVYCGNCHKVPSPSSIPKSTWEETIMPRMGYFYGIYKNDEERISLIENNHGGEIVELAEVFPKDPIIEKSDWESILDYYISGAPDSLITPKSDITITDKYFRTHFPATFLSPPATTMVQFDEEGNVFLGDANKKQLFKFDQQDEFLSAANVREGAVHLQEFSDGLWVTVMGSFSPTDEPSGFIVYLPTTPEERPSVIIKDLQRPVHTSYGDLHGDGYLDILVSEFGKWTGGLSLFRNNGEGTFAKRILHNTSGATRAYIQDMNDDNRPDIVALFAQGDEGIDIFYNRGDSNFQRNRVLRFNPSNGSSHFSLYDWNNDGHLDIIYTAGDNADYVPVMKPYHGIYIYLNDGRNQFKQYHFQHLNGAYKAIPGDFDNDGHTDLAAISFFPDWSNSPEESFVLLRNTGDEQLKFERSTVEGQDKGRWIVMDAADRDGDGDIDIVLGSLAFEVIPDDGQLSGWIQNGVPYLILENLSN